jgi:hypothetical protein
MKVLKNRIEPLELKRFKFLKARMDICEDDLVYFTNQEKGFQGEMRFDDWSKDLQGDWVVLNDLLLVYNNSLFQIDSLFYSQEKIRLFDAKNYEGDCIIEGDKWLINGKEIKNPLHQLSRCETLLKRLLYELGVNIPIDSQLIFVNPEFFLYNAPMNLPMVFPTQLNRFKNKLNLNPPKSKNPQNNPKIINQLLSLHKETSPFTPHLEYSYNQVKKGITCASCQSFLFEIKRENLVCCFCGFNESLVKAVLRSVDEYVFLFPERKITTNDILEWCGIIKSKKTIRRILGLKYAHQKKAKASFFIEKE